MRAKRILNAGAFTPDDLSRLQTAFDLAWQRIIPTVDAVDHPQARDALAIIIVAAGSVSGLDAQELADFAERTYSAVKFASDFNP